MEVTETSISLELDANQPIKNVNSLQPEELVAEGNLSELIKAIDPSQIDQKYELGLTLLHYAAKENRLEVIEYLVSGGCDINAVDDDEQTPLHKSAMFGHTESVKLLIDKGANVNKMDCDGNPPLHIVIMSGGDYCIVKALIEKANLTIQNNDDENLLHLAIRYHKVDVINLILNHKKAPALISAVDKDGLTPIHLAVNLGHFHTTEKLLNLPQITIFGNTNQGKNIIHLAAATGSAALLSHLLDSYSTLHLVNSADNMLHTPLHDAADKGRLKQVEMLLDRGAMIKRTANGFSPLHYACLQGHLSVVKKLIERHPFHKDLLTQNKDTPLHLAAIKGHADIVKFLLDCGVSLKHNDQHASFLDLAIFNTDYEVASVAVKHDRWQECLDFKSFVHPAPIISLVKNIPEVARIVLDRSITSDKLNPTYPKYWKRYDFKYIVNLPTDPAGTQQPLSGICWIIFYYLRFLFSLGSTYNAEPMNVFRTMIEYKRNKLFSHPLLLTFLNLKWMKYGRLYIQIRAGALVLLTLLLSLLIALSDPPRLNIMDTTEEELNSTSETYGYIPRSLSIAIFLVDFLYALVIMIQIFAFIRIRKVSRPLHFFIEVAAVSYTAAFLITDPIEWFTGVSALLSSWVALSLYSRYFDVFGLYTIMLYELLFKIIKVLLVGLYYIIGFGLALYVIVGEEALYSNPFKAIYAAFYGSISDLNIGIISDKEANNTLQYPITTYIAVLIFNVSVSITLINLLIGIAVEKTREIQNCALRYQAELKVQLFLELDLIIPDFLQYKIYPKEYKMNRSNGLGINRKFGNIWNRFTNLFAYDDESPDEEANVDKKDHEMAYRMSQMEDKIEHILKILTTDSKAT